MKYIIRALKYFCYLIVLLAVIILALVLTGSGPRPGIP